MIDFTKHKERREKWEKEAQEYDEAVRNAHPDALTQDDIRYLFEQNESFYGAKINAENEARFLQLKLLAADFLACCPNAYKMLSTKYEETHEQNASVYMDIGTGFLISGEAGKLYRKMIDLADMVGVVISSEDENILRLTFMVKNVWEK